MSESRQSKKSVVHLDVRGLINYVKALISKKASILSVIARPLLLVKVLEELDGLAEMYEVKQAIVQQIQLLLVTAYTTSRKDCTANVSPTTNKAPSKSKFGGHKLHTVLYGPPGVGKSKTARLMAGIWYALGVMDEMTTHKPIKVKQEPLPVPLPLLAETPLFEQLASETAAIMASIRDIQLNIVSLRSAYNPSEVYKSSNSQDGMSATKIHMIWEDKKSSWKNMESSCNDAITVAREMLSLCQPPIYYPSDDDEDEAPLPTMSSPPKTTATGEAKAPSPLKMYPPNRVNPGFNLPRLPTLPPLPVMLNSTRMGLQLPTENAPDTLDDIPVCVCGREDLVGEYQGHTAIKATAFLNANIGKVIIVEEAYLLHTGPNDQFGMEALTILNRFMDEHASEAIIVLVGYKDLMSSTIFAAQPGLRRRCQWTFDIRGYSAEGVSKIFASQVKALGWSVDPKIDTVKFFKSRMDDFPAFGGDTERLALHCKMAYSSDVFKELMDTTINLRVQDENGVRHTTDELLTGITDQVISHDNLNQALEEFKANKVYQEEDVFNRPPPPNMYQ